VQPGNLDLDMYYQTPIKLFKYLCMIADSREDKLLLQKSFIQNKNTNQTVLTGQFNKIFEIFLDFEINAVTDNHAMKAYPGS